MDHTASAHDKSIALMKFLSGVARREGAAEHIYVVGGAVRNFILGAPIKDIDVVVDSVELGRGRDSEWFARKVIDAIPAPANLTTNQYGVAIITVKGEWLLDGINMRGEVIEIANARKESYEGVGGKGKGYKPTDVAPANIREDVFRREFTFNCMTGDTLIPTENGILRIDKIASRILGDHQSIHLQVAGKDGSATAVGWQYSGFTDTLRVETAWGNYFTCTHHHPVLVLRGHDHVWVQADQLVVGDLLCTPVRQVVRDTPLVITLPDPIPPKRGGLKEVSKPGEMSPDLAFVLGCLVAEGSNTHKRVSFSNGDPALTSRYSECFHAVFGIMPSRNRVVEKGTVRTLNGVDFVANRDCFDIYADSKTVVEWLDHLGLYCDGPQGGASASHHKVIPWSILEADARSQWAFIAAYLEGDGSIRPDSGRVVFRSVSPHVRHQLQVLLGSHGVLSKIDGEFIHVNAVDAGMLWAKIRPWMVTKGFDYDTATFKSRNRYGIPVEYLSGFLSGRKIRSCGKRGVAYRTDDGGEVVVHGVGDALHNIQRFLYDAYKRGDFSEMLGGLQQISPVEYLKFRGLLDLGYQYVEVSSVTDAGKQDVYDISMGEGVEPAFVANGVVVHNTLLWRLLDLANGPDKAEIIDLTGLGRQHLEEKLIATPVDPDKTFSDDPTRQLRILKFLLRYDLKISPDVVASVKRNAHKLKDMPWEAVANILVGDILKSPKASRGLKVMRELGMLDVLVEMIQETPAFASYLTRQLASGDHSVRILLELADLGISGRVLAFLTPAQQVRFREATAGMDDAEAWKYLELLKSPTMDSLALIEEFDLQKNERAVLAPTARDALLDDPGLNTKNDITEQVRQRLRRTLKRATVAREVPMSLNDLSLRVAARYAQSVSPLEMILSEVETLEVLAAEVQVILDTYENSVPMPLVGRIAALSLASQQECFNRCEHGMRHCERVINMAGSYLQEHPGDQDVSASLRDAQTLYDRFASFRVRSREMLSAMSQKIMPDELKATVTAVLDGVRAALKEPNRVSITVHPRFAPCLVKGRLVDGMVFDAWLTAYPLPADVEASQPAYQQFLFSQATMGDDLNVYLTIIDRTDTEDQEKPMVVGALKDAVVKKVLTALKGWSNLAG